MMDHSSTSSLVYAFLHLLSKHDNAVNCHPRDGSGKIGRIVKAEENNIKAGMREADLYPQGFVIQGGMA